MSVTKACHLPASFPKHTCFCSTLVMDKKKPLQTTNKTLKIKILTSKSQQLNLDGTNQQKRFTSLDLKATCGNSATIHPQSRHNFMGHQGRAKPLMRLSGMSLGGEGGSYLPLHFYLHEAFAARSKPAPISRQTPFSEAQLCVVSVWGDRLPLGKEKAVTVTMKRPRDPNPAGTGIRDFILGLKWSNSSSTSSSHNMLLQADICW